jgi:hypothetical protein
MALLLYAVLYAGLRQETVSPRRLPLLGWLWMQVHPSALLLVPMVWTHPRYRRAVWIGMIVAALLLHPQLGMLVHALLRMVHGISGYTEWQSPLKVVIAQPGWGGWVLIPFALALWVGIRQSRGWSRGWLGFWMVLALLTTRGYPFLTLTLALELLFGMEHTPLPSSRVSRLLNLLPWVLAGWFLMVRGTPPHMPSPAFYRALPEGTGWTRQDWANPVCWYQPRARVWINGMDVPQGVPGKPFWSLYVRMLDGDPSPLMQAGIRWVLTGPGMERLEQRLRSGGWRNIREEGPYRLWVAQGSR